MAEAAVDSNMDCLMCAEECVQPVTLGCEHRFCCRCLREHWAPSDSGDCPTCKRRWSKYLPPEFALEKSDLSQSQVESSEDMEEEGRERPDQSFESMGAPSGGERREQQCVKLKEKKERTEELMKQYQCMLEHMEGQRLQCETQIRAQFDLFHQFLKEEEESQLSALRQEHQEKTQIIEEELKQLEESLSDSVRSAEQQLQGQSSSLSEIMESLVLTDEPEPQLRSGLLIDQATVLGNLGHRVWEKMGTIVKYNRVILDPNTAHRDLRLSEDLTSVGKRDTQKLLPLNPERFTNYPSVLGSEGFSSGMHWWEVEVGDHPDWTIGVVRESAKRRARSGVFPEDGFWCLTFEDNKYTDVNGVRVQLNRRPEKILVEFVYDPLIGGISFFDSSDMTPICSYSEDFTERMFPYVSVRKAGDANITKDIKVGPITTKDGSEDAQIRFESERLHDQKMKAENATWRHKLEDLRAEKRVLEVENARMCSELEELKTTLRDDKRSEKVPVQSYKQLESEIPKVSKMTRPSPPPKSVGQSTEQKPPSFFQPPNPDPQTKEELEHLRAEKRALEVKNAHMLFELEELKTMLRKYPPPKSVRQSTKQKPPSFLQPPKPDPQIKEEFTEKEEESAEDS